MLYKYIKYKKKYINIKNQIGGGVDEMIPAEKLTYEKVCDFIYSKTFTTCRIKSLSYILSQYKDWNNTKCDNILCYNENFPVHPISLPLHFNNSTINEIWNIIVSRDKEKVSGTGKFFTITPDNNKDIVF